MKGLCMDHHLTICMMCHLDHLSTEVAVLLVRSVYFSHILFGRFSIANLCRTVQKILFRRWNGNLGRYLQALDCHGNSSTDNSRFVGHSFQTLPLLCAPYLALLYRRHHLSKGDLFLNGVEAVHLSLSTMSSSRAWSYIRIEVMPCALRDDPCSTRRSPSGTGEDFVLLERCKRSWKIRARKRWQLGSRCRSCKRIRSSH